MSPALLPPLPFSLGAFLNSDQMASTFVLGVAEAMEVAGLLQVKPVVEERTSVHSV